MQIAADARDVITKHVDTLVGQLARIIADGVEQGAFGATDVPAAARAVFDATVRFHNPANAASWSDPNIDAAYEHVAVLILAGLRTSR